MQTVSSVLRGVRRVVNQVSIPALEFGAKGFTGTILRKISAARGSKIDNPPIDQWRYPGSSPESYNPTEAVRVLSFLRANAEKIDRSAALFEDQESRDLYADLWAYRALGPAHVRLPKANPEYMIKFAEAERSRVGDSPFQFPPFPLHRFAGPAGTVDCWLGNVVAALEEQYWFSRNGVSIAPRKGDTVIDGGACFGDTSLLFAEAVGPSGHVHSFEPLASQIEIFSHNLGANQDLAARITHHPFALDNKSGKQLFFSQGAGARSDDAGERVETRTIDDLRFEHVDYIKLDIEGAETACLEGARETIRRCRPKLAISAYHSMDDLASLPSLIHDIDPAYRLYLDHHTIHSEETVLYAIHPEGSA
ncbi:FkbM family methyltransferase [Sphingomonas mesophila]|uniref:FkbM family methyltransferase n=1 Tax=Sphingomonas mesophila TaxID=2303576 RepID=UPI000E570308|nr:FkbM family methyltransferase [Sphingomonas mesophila]